MPAAEMCPDPLALFWVSHKPVQQRTTGIAKKGGPPPVSIHRQPIALRSDPKTTTLRMIEPCS